MNWPADCSRKCSYLREPLDGTQRWCRQFLVRVSTIVILSYLLKPGYYMNTENKFYNFYIIKVRYGSSIVCLKERTTVLGLVMHKPIKLYIIPSYVDVRQ